MALKILSVLACIFCVNHGYLLEKSWDNDIYCGRQLDDLITQTQIPNSKVIRPVVLAMYTPSCESALNMEKLGEQRLPPQHLMVFAKYDYETCPKHIWYNLDARDDLVERYKPENCPEYLYFGKGQYHDRDEPKRYSKESGQNVFYWIWDQFALQINVANNRKGRILVEFAGQGPKISAFTIEPGQEMILDTYESYFVVISDMQKQTFLYGTELSKSSNGQIMVMDQDTKMEKRSSEWFNEIRGQQEKKSQDARSWRWNLAEIYLHDFKQPVLLEKFTDLGYKKGTIPKDLYKEMIDFYKTNIKNRKPETHEVEPAINDSEVKCSMVFLSDEMIQKIAKVMKPIMEEWSNCSLELSRLYGIREYYRGNLLRNHVDRVTTHVISVILQIDKDLEGNPDWELEIIGFDGVRKNVTLQPGEMLFYESATLIHGRPFPYQGRVFANAFLHYKPIHGWGWDLSEDGHYIINNKQNIEKIDIFSTKNTHLKKANLEMFVEKRHEHTHDEL